MSTTIPRRDPDVAVVLGLLAVGLIELALNPRRTLRLLAGGSWWDR